MKVLVVTRDPPMPPLDGLRLVVAALVPELLREHEVRVVCLDAPRDGTDPSWLHVVPPAPTGTTAADLAAFARGRPLHWDRRTAPLLDEVRRHLSSWDPDVVHVVGGQVPGVPALANPRPVVVSALDAAHRNIAARANVATGARRLGLRVQTRFVRRWVATEYTAATAVVLVTQEDAAEVQRVAPDSNVRVVPNGVDADRFHPGAASARDPGTITFHGVMRYAPNVDAALWAADEILPAVRARVPDATLLLVGRSPHPEVAALAERPGIRVTGGVDDIAPWLARTSVYLCPMRHGTGIKNKLLEAMACGAPCVATPLAAQGIRVDVGTDLRVGRSADELAQHTADLLADPVAADALGTAARRRVVEDHSWGAVADAYTRLYATLVAEAQR